MYDLRIGQNNHDVTALLYTPRSKVTQVLFHAVLNDILFVTLNNLKCMNCRLARHWAPTLSSLLLHFMYHSTDYCLQKSKLQNHSD